MKSVIVLEALDGVGKSTVAKLVAKKLNAVVYRPSGRIKHATNEAIKLPYGSQERSGAIRNTLTMMSKEIKQVAQAYPVILDRFYASWASAEAGATPKGLPSSLALFWAAAALMTQAGR